MHLVQFFHQGRRAEHAVSRQRNIDLFAAGDLQDLPDPGVHEGLASAEFHVRNAKPFRLPDNVAKKTHVDRRRAFRARVMAGPDVAVPASEIASPRVTKQ